MKIVKYKKLNDNRYNIILDNGNSIKLYDDTIIKFNLLNKKDIELNEEIEKYNKELEAYYKSIKYITRKMRCEGEIRRYLIDYPSRVIDKTIDRLIKEKYIDDDLYIKIYIKDQVNITSYGKNKIYNKLIILGLDKDKVRNELDNYDNKIFRDKLDKLIDKKINSNYKYSKNKLREKILIDLINNGYNKEDIISILNSKEIKVSSDIYDKEYNKVYKALSKKYDGIELKNRIVQKLVSKGFNYEDIKNRM